MLFRSMKNRVSLFNNWESLCLFDSFTTIGNNGLLTHENNDIEKGKLDTWQDTYFRIYLFRLFFKYNLFRYNSELHKDTVNLRNRFERFLNEYNLNHISYNFQPNEIFQKTGIALDLENELTLFQQRINRISSAIQEEKQSRMNKLLQIVTILSIMASIQPIFDLLSWAQTMYAWSDKFQNILQILIFVIWFSLLFFILFSDKVLKYFQKNHISPKQDEGNS